MLAVVEVGLSLVASAQAQRAQPQMDGHMHTRTMVTPTTLVGTSADGIAKLTVGLQALDAVRTHLARAKAPMCLLRVSGVSGMRTCVDPCTMMARTSTWPIFVISSAVSYGGWRSASSLAVAGEAALLQVVIMKMREV